MVPSRSFARSLIVLLAAICWGAVGAAAPTEAPAPESQQVLITASAPDREQKSYRDALSAMERFERYKAKHPDAVLRMHILPRKDGVDLSQLRVWLHDPEDGRRIDIDVGADGRFTLPVVPTLRDHDSTLRTNMLDGTLTWVVEVTRAGDDDRHHLLGDLREACRLDVSHAHFGRTIKPPALRAIEAMVDNICLTRGVGWGAYADKPVFSVHLTAGDRHAILLSDVMHCKLALPILIPLTDACMALRDRVYASPLNDASWPDDTRVTLVYADDPDDTAPPSALAIPSLSTATQP